jgi:hypothetical protein
MSVERRPLSRRHKDVEQRERLAEERNAKALIVSVERDRAVEEEKDRLRTAQADLKADFLRRQKERS